MGGKVKGKLNLLKVDSLEALTTDLERLETLIEVLETREMPPEPEPALSPSVREAMVGELRGLLRAALANSKRLQGSFHVGAAQPERPE